MKSWHKTLLVLAAAALLAGLVGVVWHNAFELRWKPEQRPSEGMLKNEMHVATLLLKKRGHGVTVAGTLGETPIDKLPDGTLLIANGFGTMAPDTATKLLAWVERGNTLITQPRWISEAEAEAVNSAASDDDTGDDTDDDTDDDSGADSAADSADAAAAPASASTPPPATDDDDDDDDEASDFENRMHGRSDALAALVEPDPVAVHFGVREGRLPLSPVCLAKRKLRAQRSKGKAVTSCPAPILECEVNDLRHLTVPGTSHAIELQTWRNALVSVPEAVAPLWSDDSNNAVRVYGHGKGKVVMVASNYFENEQLQNKDHGELLLALTALAGQASHVTVIQYLNVLPWYQLLWSRFHMTMLGALALLLLALWAALRRFGPMLPEPALERRSLMEHIDASGAWLWNAGGGREVLLQAAREDTLTVLKRRVPGMMRLPEHELAAALGAACQLPPQQVEEALHHPAASQPQQFARQIRTLQHLRTHHER
ncbi:MAG TPA: DUF4350 domain-containing protein [Telluria sp.]|jgi:hypothetical protein